MILIDTGFLIALIDASDTHHARAAQFSSTADEGWITTWPVLSEAVYLLSTRLHLDAALAVLDDVSSGVLRVWDMPVEAASAVKTLMKKYRNLPMDLADASLVLLAEHQNSGRILTTDTRDFGAYRWKARRPFQDLMGVAAGR